MFLSRLKYAFFLVSQSHYDTAGLNYEKLRNIAAKYNIAVRYYSISRVGTLLEEEEEEEEEYNPKPHPNPCLAMTLTPDLNSNPKPIAIPHLYSTFYRTPTQQLFHLRNGAFRLAYHEISRQTTAGLLSCALSASQP